jgi:hypothetical protein
MAPLRPDAGGRSFMRVDDLLLLITSAALAKFASERTRHCESCSDELHLLPPFQAQSLLDAGVAVFSAATADQELADFLRDSPVIHWKLSTMLLVVRARQRAALIGGLETPGQTPRHGDTPMDA